MYNNRQNLNVMHNEFIPYEQALELKELGFNESCLGYYLNSNRNLIIAQRKTRKNAVVLAPLFQQAFRFLISMQDEFKVCLDEDGWFIYNLENEIYRRNAIKKLIEILKLKKC